MREVLQYLTYRTRSARHAGCDQSLRPVIQKQKNREISKKSDKIHLKRCLYILSNTVAVQLKASVLLSGRTTSTTRDGCKHSSGFRGFWRRR